MRTVFTDFGSKHTNHTGKFNLVRVDLAIIHPISFDIGGQPEMDLSRIFEQRWI